MPYMMIILLLAFTVITTILYAVCPSRQRYIVLLVVSLAFLLYINSHSIVFIAITILTTFLSGIIMDNIVQKHDTKGLDKETRKKIKAKVKHKKQLVVLGYLIINIGILLTLKYFNFFATSITNLLNKFGGEFKPFILKIAIPLGLSYYTLQALGYVIDVFRGKYKAEKNILKVALFVSFLPQLHEGPFGRYDLLMPQMEKGENINSKNLYNGIARILWGLFKIFMIANRASIISDAIFKEYNKYGGFNILLGGIAFTIQLYAEFSGYIDMASGISKIFGIELSKNFDLPFISQNIGEFWRRWHISLGSWFRDYVFYPVSTSKFLRKSTQKLNFNTANFITITVSLLVIWFLTGLWHGASFKYVCYGLYYFVLMMIFNIVSPHIEKLLDKNNIHNDNKVLVSLRIVKTLLLVLIGMIMFRAENMVVFKDMIISIFKSGATFHLFKVLDIQDFIALIVSLIIVLIGAVIKIKGVDIQTKYDNLSCYKKYFICFALFSIVMIFGAYGLDYLPPDPIYGGF